jgi:hypothetical protein
VSFVVAPSGAKQVDLEDGLPLNAKIHKATTKKVLKDAKERCNLESFANPQDLFASLNI